MGLFKRKSEAELLAELRKAEMRAQKEKKRAMIIDKIDAQKNIVKQSRRNNEFAKGLMAVGKGIAKGGKATGKFLDSIPAGGAADVFAGRQPKGKKKKKSRGASALDMSF